MANGESNNVMKLGTTDGAVLGTFTVGTLPLQVASEGANIWVTKLNTLFLQFGHAAAASSGSQAHGKLKTHPRLGYQSVSDTWGLAKVVRKVEFKLLQIRDNLVSQNVFLKLRGGLKSPAPPGKG